MHIQNPHILQCIQRAGSGKGCDGGVGEAVRPPLVPVAWAAEREEDKPVGWGRGALGASMTGDDARLLPSGKPYVIGLNSISRGEGTSSEGKQSRKIFAEGKYGTRLVGWLAK